MGKHIVFIGAGAVGGYVGAHLARVGEDVALVDPWAEHIEAIKRDGMHLGGSQGEHVVTVKAMHIHEVQSFVRKPVDIAIICTKSYDTEWATMMIKQYLSPQGYIVSMQNGINEERIAGVAGWGKTVGCALSTISVNCFKPGHISRYQQPGGANHTVFRVGEIHGRVTERVTERPSSDATMLARERSDRMRARSRLGSLSRSAAIAYSTVVLPQPFRPVSR